MIRSERSAGEKRRSHSVDHECDLRLQSCFLSDHKELHKRLPRKDGERSQVCCILDHLGAIRGIRFRMTYNGSGIQARAVIDGLPSDIVALALPLDVIKIEQVCSQWRRIC